MNSENVSVGETPQCRSIQAQRVMPDGVADLSGERWWVVELVMDDLHAKQQTSNAA